MFPNGKVNAMLHVLIYATAKTCPELIGGFAARWNKTHTLLTSNCSKLASPQPLNIFHTLIAMSSILRLTFQIFPPLQWLATRQTKTVISSTVQC